MQENEVGWDVQADRRFCSQRAPRTVRSSERPIGAIFKPLVKSRGLNLAVRVLERGKEREELTTAAAAAVGRTRSLPNSQLV